MLSRNLRATIATSARLGHRMLRAIALLAALSLPVAATAAELSGVVRDPLGDVIVGADVTLRTGEGAAVSTVSTDDSGRYRFVKARPGHFLVEVEYPGFDLARRSVHLAESATTLDIDLALGLHSQLTVSASPGRAGAVAAAVQPVNVIDEQTIARRATAVIAEAVRGEAGVQVQRTAPGVAGVYVRGLGGRNVSVFVDGVRYSTAAQRGGIKTFLGLLEPSSLGSVEVLRGPQGAQYGSASLGGSLQLQSHAPRFASAGHEIHGRTRLAFASADQGFSLTQTAGWSGERSALVIDLWARRVNTLRPADGLDDHAAVTRYLGLDSSVLGGERLPDTAFTGYGGALRLDWSPAAGDHLTLSYRRGQQDGVKRYDRLLGGDGDSLADIRGLTADLLTLRWETSSVAWLDTLSVTGSYNAQREERVRQGGKGDPSAPVRHEYERTEVVGLQARGRRPLGPIDEAAFGVEVYAERVGASGHQRDVVTDIVSLRRPRVPGDARYTSGGAWFEGTSALLDARLRLTGAVRASFADYRARASDAPLVDGQPLWPDDDLTVSDLTWRLGATYQLSDSIRLGGGASRGFRAPSITDLGTLGLTGSGFEVASADVAGLSGEIGSSADADAVTLGAPVIDLAPETSLQLEAWLRYESSNIAFQVGGYLHDIDGAVEKRALILAPGAVGLEIGGEPIVEQLDSGVVFVDLSSTPVLIRANVSDIRVWGIEQTLELRLSSALTLTEAFTFVRASDRLTGASPSISGATPAPHATVDLRWQPPASRWFAAGRLHGILRQERLSSLALQDRRIGGFRDRDDIADFFSGGATVRGLVGPGDDGRPGTDDDRLLETGETLGAVQDRVLGPGVTGAPLFDALPGWVTLDLELGLEPRPGQALVVELSNLLDARNRGMAAGVPGAGRGLRLRYDIRY